MSKVLGLDAHADRNLSEPGESGASDINGPHKSRIGEQFSLGKK